MSTRHSLVIRAALLVLLLSPVSAFAQQPRPAAPAQDNPTFGLVATAPNSALGFMWNYSDRIAVRPEFAWTTNSSTNSATTTTVDSTSVGPGVAVLYYTAKWDAVKAYASPRYAFSHNSSTTTTAAGATSATTNVNNISGSIGAEYGAHRHFAAFGEVGLNYAHSKSSSTVSTTTNSSNSWGFRSSVGAIFYF